jgi:hypothetical protein
MSAIGKPATAARKQDMLDLLQAVKELKSTEHADVLCYALQHCVTRVKKVSDRRKQRMQMKEPVGLKLDTEPDFSASAEFDLEAALEKMRPKVQKKSVQDRKLHKEPCKPNVVSDSVRYFEIMSFKTIREGDCESEASDDISTALETENSNSTDSIHADSPSGVQDSMDWFGAESEEISTPEQADVPYSEVGISSKRPRSSALPGQTRALRKENCDMGMLFVRFGGVETKRKSSLWSSAKKLFLQITQEQVCKCDDDTDEVDVMGMAIL